MKRWEVARSLALFAAMMIPLVGSGSPPAAAAKAPPNYAPAWPRGGGGYQQAGGGDEGHNWGVGGGGDHGSLGILEGGEQPGMGGLRGGQPQGGDGELVGHVGQVTKLVEDSVRQPLWCSVLIPACVHDSAACRNISPFGVDQVQVHD